MTAAQALPVLIGIALLMVAVPFLPFRNKGPGL